MQTKNAGPVVRLAAMFATALVIGFPFSGCKKEDPPQVQAAAQMAELGKQMAAAGEQMRAAGEQMRKARAQGSPIPAAEAMKGMAEAMRGRDDKGVPLEPVDFRKLKALLPETLVGLKRSKVGGEKSGAMGMVVARADARYQGDDKSSSVRVRITDVGGMAGVMAMATFGWATVEIDREDDNGYEKTLTIAGHKAIEKYRHKRKDGKLQVMVANRFHVEADSDGIEPAALRKIVEEIDLGALAALR